MPSTYIKMTDAQKTKMSNIYKYIVNIYCAFVGQI